MRKRNILICGAVLVLAGVGAMLLYPETPKEPKDTRFVKIRADGKKIGIWKGPWQCVLDRETNLIWEVKGYNQNMHSTECSFSWFDGALGLPKGGNCYTADTHSDTKELVDFFNRNRVCGFDNWRVPTLKELQSLIYREVTPHKPLIRYDLFPRTQKAPYWSSDAPVTLKSFFKGEKGAYALNFENGKVEALPFRSASFLRLVADGE